MAGLGNKLALVLSCCFYGLKDVNANNSRIVDSSNRIVGGSDVPVESYPWFVKFGGCGGSLISPEFVLTAGEFLESTMYFDS